MHDHAIDASRQLSALATGLCQDSGIRVELSSRTWAWDPLRRVILVSEQDLNSKGATYCAAVLAHEVSHYFISRYHLFTLDFPSAVALPQVLNAIEDPRVNTWIKRRYPGTGRWLQRLTEEDGSSPLRGPMPDFILFCLECAREELRSWVPLPAGILPEAIVSALERTRSARIAFANTLPAGDMMPDCSASELMEMYRWEVWPSLVGRAQLDLPTLREQWVRSLTLASLRIAERDILPVAAEMLQRDLDRITRWLTGSGDRAGRLREALAAGADFDLRQMLAEAMQGEPGKPDAPAETRDLARRAFEAWLNALQEAPPKGAGSKPLIAEARPGCAGERGEFGRPAHGVWRGRAGLRLPIRLPAPATAYDRAHAKIADQVQHLVQSIEALLRPRKRLRESVGHPSGHRLDLRRVQAFDADPRQWNKLWRRKNVPHRHDTAVSLLVDLSGSMRGAKTDAALAGTVLLAETLHRLQVPFAINGFQDVLIPFCDFFGSLTPRVRESIGQMPHEVEGSRENGNNSPSFNDDGPCVREAAEQFLKHSATDRVLIVVSDGMPEGRRSNEADLRQSIADLGRDRRLKLVGIGLGPDTGHVREFYPNSIADVPTHRLAEEIGQLLRDIWK